MAALLQSRRSSAPAPKTTTIKIPAWAIARRLSGRDLQQQGSPDSMAKRTVQTLPSEDDESLALPRMENKDTAITNVLLKMDVTGFRVEDLHVDVDTNSKRLNLAGKGPRMFKRSFPIPAYDQVDIEGLQATVVFEDSGRKYLILKAPVVTNNKKEESVEEDDDSSVDSLSRRSIVIKDETRPPTLIAIPGPREGTDARAA